MNKRGNRHKFVLCNTIVVWLVLNVYFRCNTITILIAWISNVKGMSVLWFRLLLNCPWCRWFKKSNWAVHHFEYLIVYLQHNVPYLSQYFSTELYIFFVDCKQICCFNLIFFENDLDKYIFSLRVSYHE